MPSLLFLRGEQPTSNALFLTKDIGRTIEETEFVEGIVIDKVALEKDLPLKIENPRISL